MRKIERTGQFKRDYKRESKGRHGIITLDADLRSVLTALIDDRALAPRHRDHALTGDWGDHRDCHLRPDLVLIYRKPDAETLQLVRLGSHSELGL
jgi:mRNA interferase YafQ